MLEYQLDQIKIVNFLLIDKFWPRELFFCTPSNICIIHIILAMAETKAKEKDANLQKKANDLEKELNLQGWCTFRFRKYRYVLL